MKALVWFNGPSARNFINLPRQEIEIGCNHFADLRLVDHICCLDERMKSTITRRESIKYWCKNGYRSAGWDEVTYVMSEQPENSGMLAIKLAINLGCTNIRIVGCDWGLDNSSMFETLYDNPKPGKKYNNESKRVLREWSKHRDIKFIHPGLPDVPLDVVDKVDL
jgi:hypothetical protein